ncbi:hypothetical protein [Vibrio sp. Isolate30]|uniref:hypothetical protein n=1 Tax=Vibrio sp. Isolate30 TaxID=2908536 RepID=UPI001EFD18A0|nr:hypothetical protein [Vibrio sp. Isolate30]MCG9630152.1 hypothetical protein [Vibrio sp. Isolate30]
MGIINKTKKKVQGNTSPDHGSSSIDPELKSALDKILQPQSTQPPRPNRVSFDDGCDGYYSKGNWWNDDNVLDHEQYKEDAFDQYACEYHSAETNEERYQLYNQDRSWMIN